MNQEQKPPVTERLLHSLYAAYRGAIAYLICACGADSPMACMQLRLAFAGCRVKYGTLLLTQFHVFAAMHEPPEQAASGLLMFHSWRNDAAARATSE